MEFDRRRSGSVSQDGGERGAQTPGRRNLTDSLALQPAHVGPSHPGNAHEAAAPPPDTAPSGPRPTLQMLFGRRTATTEGTGAPPGAAQDAEQATSAAPTPEEELADLGANTRERHDERIAKEGDQVTTTRQTSRQPHAMPGAGQAARDVRAQRALVPRDAALRGALEAAGFPVAAPHTLDLSARITDGPMFDDNEVAAVQQASQTAHGRSWLQRAGLFSLAEASDYLAAKQYQGWLKLAPANRLLLAALAWRWQLKSFPPTPAYSLARHIVLASAEDAAHDDGPRIRDERDGDIRQTWVDTLAETQLNEPATQAIASGAVTTVPQGKRGAVAEKVGLFHAQPRTDANQIADENSRAAEIVKRVFLVLQAGLKVYRAGEGDHVDFRTGDVARALAHGGRVNIHIPPLTAGQTGEELPEWLGIRNGGRSAGRHVFERGFGTHDVEIRKAADGSEEMIETGGLGANFKHMRSKTVYGMNIAVGGLGKRDCNGDVILPDGSHGHMFIAFIPPTAALGGSLQIGMETTAPGAPSPVGYAHTAKSTEATANPESSSYGHKSDKIGEGAPAKVNLLGRPKKNVTNPKATVPQYVDLAEVNLAHVHGGQWRDYLEALRTGWLEPMLASHEPQAQRRTLETLVGPRGVALYADPQDRATGGGERAIVGYERRDQLSRGGADEHDPGWTQVTVQGTARQLWARTDALAVSR